MNIHLTPLTFEITRFNYILIIIFVRILSFWIFSKVDPPPHLMIEDTAQIQRTHYFLYSLNMTEELSKYR